MFRPMRRFGQQLSPEECVRILERAPRGVLSVQGEDGYPYGVPVDHYFKEGKLYFHCALEGHKLDAIRRDDRVSYCVLDEGKPIEDYWALTFDSVIAFGRIRPVEDRERARELTRELAEKYMPEQEEVERTLRKHFEQMMVLEMTIEHMTGKHVKES